MAHHLSGYIHWSGDGPSSLVIYISQVMAHHLSGYIHWSGDDPSSLWLSE